MSYNRPNGDTYFQEQSAAKQPLKSANLDGEITGLKSEVNKKLNTDGSIPMTGTLTCEGPLEFTESGDEYIRVPRITTAQRDALAPVDGILIFNTSTLQNEIYSNSAWNAVVDESNSSAAINGKVMGVYTTAQRDALTAKAQQLIYNSDTSVVEICTVASGGAGKSAWAPSIAYALNDGVTAVTPNDLYWYECTTAGTSGTVEPVWPLTVGATVNDGTAIWTCRLQAQWKGIIDENAGAKLKGLINSGYTAIPNFGVVYQALTDLWVSVWWDNAVTQRAFSIEVGLTAAVGAVIARDSAMSSYGGCSAIIPSGYYYRINTSNGSGTYILTKTAIGG